MAKATPAQLKALRHFAGIETVDLAKGIHINTIYALVNNGLAEQPGDGRGTVLTERGWAALGMVQPAVAEETPEVVEVDEVEFDRVRTGTHTVRGTVEMGTAMNLVELMRLRAAGLKAEGEKDEACALQECAASLDVFFNHPPMAAASMTLKEILWEVAQQSRKAYDVA